jgi:pyruvate carboxylase
VDLAKGVSAIIKFKAMGELQPNGKREVFFEANGVPRVVEVIDRAAEKALGATGVRDKVRCGGSYAGKVSNIVSTGAQQVSNRGPTVRCPT